MSTYIRGSGKTGRRNAEEARFKASKGRFTVALPQWASDAITEIAMQNKVTRCRLVCEWVLAHQESEVKHGRP